MAMFKKRSNTFNLRKKEEENTFTKEQDIKILTSNKRKLNNTNQLTIKSLKKEKIDISNYLKEKQENEFLEEDKIKDLAELRRSKKKDLEEEEEEEEEKVIFGKAAFKLKEAKQTREMNELLNDGLEEMENLEFLELEKEMLKRGGLKSVFLQKENLSVFEIPEFSEFIEKLNFVSSEVEDDLKVSELENELTRLEEFIGEVDFDKEIKEFSEKYDFYADLSEALDLLNEEEQDLVAVVSVFVEWYKKYPNEFMESQSFLFIPEIFKQEISENLDDCVWLQELTEQVSDLKGFPLDKVIEKAKEYLSNR